MPLAESAEEDDIALNDRAENHSDWPAFRAAAMQCHQCDLSSTRQRVVLGQGALQPHWLIVTPAPDHHAEVTDTAISGEAAVLLEQMLRACGLHGQQVHVTPAVKCRLDQQDAMAAQAACKRLLQQQIALLQPKLLLILGLQTGAIFLQQAGDGLELRGQLHQNADSGVPLIITHHPVALLQHPALKAEAWQDLQLAMAHTGLLQ